MNVVIEAASQLSFLGWMILSGLCWLAAFLISLWIDSAWDKGHAEMLRRQRWNVYVFGLILWGTVFMFGGLARWLHS